MNDALFFFTLDTKNSAFSRVEKDFCQEILTKNVNVYHLVGQETFTKVSKALIFEVHELFEGVDFDEVACMLLYGSECGCKEHCVIDVQQLHGIQCACYR